MTASEENVAISRLPTGRSWIDIAPDQDNEASTTGGAGLPVQVLKLLPREREIATSVYEMGACTANQVLGCLSVPISNAAVRSMLNRLVRKQILNRIKSGNRFVYVPALTNADSRTLALKQFAEDHFNGSVAVAAAAMTRLRGRV